jgi:hypothetical protein
MLPEKTKITEHYEYQTPTQQQSRTLQHYDHQSINNSGTHHHHHLPTLNNQMKRNETIL